MDELQAELHKMGLTGNPDVVMRGLIVVDQVGSLCRFITHDQVLNPTVRPHENPGQEMHAAGHALVQLMTLIEKRGINIEQALNLALQDCREGTVLKKPPSEGVMAAAGTVHGEAIVVESWGGITSINRQQVKGKILVTNHASAEVPLHLFAGIITDEGGYSCHAGIIARECDIPCVVGMGNATQRFHTGDLLSISDGIVRVIKHG